LARQAEEHLREVHLALHERGPERVRQLLENAQAEARAANEKVREVEDEQRDVAARLDLLGERGLFEAREDARTQLARARHGQRSLHRRATAARLLYDTMAHQRERAREAYAAPLRSTIERLGRHVFGGEFTIELDPELRIATRTMDGTTLPFEQLSVGAREQLSLLARVACALLVDETDGVPLLFDDVLGHSDPKRAAGMSRMLEEAAARCQIIVMTCAPDRLATLEGAHYIRLGATEPPPKPASLPAPKPAPARKAKSRPRTPTDDLPLFANPPAKSP
ncbi:MAG: hypothetical protein OER88_11255, partial [Planctomycetota bacterium]|nr:hypothetical protein [Planctomycetota bacterium]